MAAPIPPEAIASFLEQTSLFRGCGASMLAKLAPHVERRQTARGAAILAAGPAPSALGILFSGSASLRLGMPGTGADTAIEELFHGDIFGEIGLLTGGTHPLSVVALEDCVTLHIRKAHFEQLVNGVPALAAALAKRVSARMLKVSQAGLKRPEEPATPSRSMPAVAAPEPKARAGEIRFCEVASFHLTPQVMDMVPTKVILQHRLLPLELRGRTLVVGMVNPSALDARQELRRILHSVDPEIVAISADDWAQTLVRLKLNLAERSQAAAGGAAAKPTWVAEQKREQEKREIFIGDEVVQLLDRIVIEAVERGASDIHVEPEAAAVRVRYRIQGMLLDRKEVVPASLAAPLIARIKVLAELDITERRLPQDGRIVAYLGKRELNLRVATLPTARGEKAAIRLLDPADVMRPFAQIFLDPQVAEMAQRAISAEHGALLVAGPTGAGKSTTLYSMLNQRRTLRPDNNIVTVEDPVEYPFPGMTQVSVNTKAGLDYPTVLRALMRQDPDVLVLGELRDAPSAHIAVEAALTGHLLLATLHGSSVVSVLQRLQHFGIQPLLLSQALSTIVVQRLSRRLCPSCAREEEVAPALLDSLAEAGLVSKSAGTRVARAVGCDLCDKTGYLGRVAVIEILSLQHEDLRAAMAAGVPHADLLQKAAASSHYVSFARCVKMLMARKMIGPADALLAVAG